MNEIQQTLASQYYNVHRESNMLEEKLIDAILIVLGVQPDDVENWPCEDFTFDWYDTSFELKQCKPEDFNITEAHYEAFASLGFSRCWLCFGERDKAGYVEKYHTFPQLPTKPQGVSGE